MYCALCSRPVEAKRHIGGGTIVLALLTVGVSLVAVPFYPKRCSICRSAAVSLLPPDAPSDAAGGPPLARLADLEQRLGVVEEELESAGLELRRIRAERDFYSQLLDNPARGGHGHGQGQVEG
jgi:hypothetical protein